MKIIVSTSFKMAKKLKNWKKNGTWNFMNRKNQDFRQIYSSNVHSKLGRGGEGWAWRIFPRPYFFIKRYRIFQFHFFMILRHSEWRNSVSIFRSFSPQKFFRLNKKKINYKNNFSQFFKIKTYHNVFFWKKNLGTKMAINLKHHLQSKVHITLTIIIYIYNFS